MVSTKDVIEHVKHYRDQSEDSLTEVAERAGISKAWLSELENGNGEMGLDVANRLLAASGYELQIVKRRLRDYRSEASNEAPGKRLVKNDGRE